MFSHLKSLWKSHQRWVEADRKGWGMAGRLFTLTEEEGKGFKGKWVVRSANRLYRLVNTGNPWVPCKIGKKMY